MRHLAQRQRVTWQLDGERKSRAVFPTLGSPGTLRDRSLRSTAFEPFSERQLRLFGSRPRRRTA